MHLGGADACTDHLRQLHVPVRLVGEDLDLLEHRGARLDVPIYGGYTGDADLIVGSVKFWEGPSPGLLPLSPVRKLE